MSWRLGRELISHSGGCLDLLRHVCGRVSSGPVSVGVQGSLRGLREDTRGRHQEKQPEAHWSSSSWATSPILAPGDPGCWACVQGIMPVCAAPVVSGRRKGGGCESERPTWCVPLEKTQGGGVHSERRHSGRQSARFPGSRFHGTRWEGRTPLLCKDRCGDHRLLSAASAGGPLHSLQVGGAGARVLPLWRGPTQRLAHCCIPSHPPQTRVVCPQTGLLVSCPVEMIPVVQLYLLSLRTAAHLSRPSVTWPGRPVCQAGVFGLSLPPGDV